MHTYFSTQDVGSNEKRGENRRSKGISEEEDTNFYWKGLERLGGRGNNLITVVRLCLNPVVNDSCASWDLWLYFQRE